MIPNLRAVEEKNYRMPVEHFAILEENGTLRGEITGDQKQVNLEKRMAEANIERYRPIGTHNHPHAIFGGTNLSVPDVATSLRCGFGEMRATSPYGVVATVRYAPIPKEKRLITSILYFYIAKFAKLAAVIGILGGMMINIIAFIFPVLMPFAGILRFVGLIGLAVMTINILWPTLILSIILSTMGESGKVRYGHTTMGERIPPP